MGRRVNALEKQTGQVLFQRTIDGFLLTEEGASVVAIAEQMEESSLAMERRLAGEMQRLEGTLRVSSADWFGAWVLPPVVEAFSNTYPHVDIELLTGFRLFSLAQREADIAFRIVAFEGADIIREK